MNKEKLAKLVEKGLEPKEHDRYFSITCPGCGKHADLWQERNDLEKELKETKARLEVALKR